MDELLARATQGVDMDSPGAFWHVYVNLLNMVPWAAMFWWSLAFVVVGLLLAGGAAARSRAHYGRGYWGRSVGSWYC